jgi:hypothetical protein
MTPIDYARKHLKTAKACLARYKTLLAQEEATMEAARDKSNATDVWQGDALCQSAWLIERRMKSIARFELDVVEYQRRLDLLLEKDVDTTSAP